jgi:hypothetical protein
MSGRTQFRHWHAFVSDQSGNRQVAFLDRVFGEAFY